MPRARLRRVKSVDPQRLLPAVHAALQIAGAVTRSWPNPPEPRLPPADAAQWRRELRRSAPRISVDTLLDDLWGRGIPVVPIDVLPSPSFQGMACIVEDRPAILLGHKHDELGRVAFIIAHEVAHLVGGDVTAEEPVVDEEESIGEQHASERRADDFAAAVLVGDQPIETLRGHDFRQLARAAASHERAAGTDASYLLFAWAAATDDYATATRAVKALYRSSGARRLLRERLVRHLSFEGASESDRSLLRCVIADGEPAASAD